MEPWEAFLSMLAGGAGGASLAAYAARAIMRDEIGKIVNAAIEKERAEMRERFATREDVLRLEAKIDVLIARLGGV